MDCRVYVTGWTYSQATTKSKCLHVQSTLPSKPDIRGGTNARHPYVHRRRSWCRGFNKDYLVELSKGPGFPQLDYALGPRLSGLESQIRRCCHLRLSKSPTRMQATVARQVCWFLEEQLIESDALPVLAPQPLSASNSRAAHERDRLGSQRSARKRDHRLAVLLTRDDDISS